MVSFHNVFKFYKTPATTKVILDHVSLVFERGYSYGILGINGAGKSTLMRLISGTELPNAGRVKRHCNVSWPLGFAGSLHPDMSAQENVAFVSRVYNHDPREVISFVRDFAEIGAYMKAPVKTYSSGMLQRVAFGLSMAIDFDCYLVDEVMAVGDARFQKRCREEFEKRREKSDIILISHDMLTIRSFCDRAIVLENGRIHQFEDVSEAIEFYKVLNR
jgi:capsular polysaccharide transport system ATP-binding protein